MKKSIQLVVLAGLLAVGAAVAAPGETRACGTRGFGWRSQPTRTWGHVGPGDIVASLIRLQSELRVSLTAAPVNKLFRYVLGVN